MRGRRSAAVAVAVTVVGSIASIGGRVGAQVNARVVPHASTSAELVKNGNAENGLADWTPENAPQVVSYGTSDFPSATSPGPADRGTKFFAGGNGGSSAIQQTISLIPYVKQIKSGNLQVQVSAYLGGFQNQSDDANAFIEVKRGTKTAAVVGLYGAGTISRGKTTGLLHVQRDIPVPFDATSLIYSVTFNPISGGYNDGYADDLSAKLINIGGRTAPPPAPPRSSPELLKNPRFEAGPGGTGEYTTIPNWSGGTFTAVKYGTPLFPAVGGMVPSDHGANFAAGGESAEPLMYQQAQIPFGYLRLVASGKVVVQVSDYDGGFSTDPDEVDGVFAAEKDGGTQQADDLPDGADNAIRQNQTGLLYQMSTFVLSPLANSIELEYRCVNKQGVFCDGYIDDVSLRLLNMPALPTITKVAPSSARRAKSTAITITGTNFKKGAILNASGAGVAITNVKVVTATKITATISISASAAIGKRTLTLVNSDLGQVMCTGCVTVG